MFTLAHFGRFTRVELHPATDRWMMGDRYGNVQHVGKKYVHVLMDRSNKVIRVAPENIGAIIENGQKSYA